jgi:hypothetical protein
MAGMAVRASIAHAASQSDTACHSWVALKNALVVGFHFGIVNELWLRTAQIIEAPRQLCAFDGQGEGRCR